MMTRHILSQHVLQSTTHSFNHSITFWVVWRGSGLFHVEQHTHFLEQLGFKASSLVGVDLFWRTVPSFTSFSATVFASWFGIANASFHFVK